MGLTLTPDDHKRWRGIRQHGPESFSVRRYVGHNPLTGARRRRSISFHATSKTGIDKAYRKILDQLDAERDGLAASGSLADLDRLRLEVEARLVDLEAAIGKLMDSPIVRQSATRHYLDTDDHERP